MSVAPELVDARWIAEAYGIERSTAERIMRTLETCEWPGVRRVFVRKADVAAALQWHKPIVNRAARR